MKVLMVNKFLYPRGGAETYVLKVGEALSRRGHQVEYFGMYDKRNTVGNRAGQASFHMDFRSKTPLRLLYPFKIIYSAEARRKLGRVLDAFLPDVVHLNNINFQLTPSVIDEGKAHGLPLVQTVHDYQMICPNHLLYNLKEEAVCERCVRGSKWNCAKYGCIHGSRVKSLLGSAEAALYWGRGTYRRVDRYLCPSRFLEHKLLSASGIYRGRTEVLRNFIELPDLSRLAGPDGRIEKEDYVIFAGRLDREKGVHLIAGAARRLPDMQFVVAGAGAMEPALRGLGNLRLAGFVAGTELQRLIAKARLMVVPSVWWENCPLSILEAHALGTPVVAANAGGMAELVEDGVTGVFLREMSGQGLAETLSRVMADRPALARMSQSCLERRACMMTLDEYCVRLEQIYGSLCKRREDV